MGAVVTVKPEFKGKVTLEDIQAHMRSRLAPFKIPIYIKFIDESLPRNANGKVSVLFLLIFGGGERTGLSF